MRLKKIITVLLGITFFAACKPFVLPEAAQKSDTVSDAVTATMAAINTASPMPIPTARSTVINPLTGLPVNDPTLLDRRPVMVKVSNFPRLGRPHAGLSFADIVFDYYIGYGTNRFLALYYGQDSPSIGPVRSGRRVDAQLVTMYGGVLGYGSADHDTDQVLVNTLGEYAISNLEAPCPAFCGESTHDAIGVFANSQAISDYVTAKGLKNSKPDLPNMIFSKAPPLGAQYGNQISVLYSFKNRAEWRYDPDSGKYLRWIEYMQNEDGDEYEMIPLTDRVTGQQLAFSNVILIFAEYTELAPSAHEINIWGNDKGQQAYLFRDGLLTQGSWRAKNDTDPMQFFDRDGQPYALKPGNTWVVITGLSSSINETQPGNWEMFFFLP
jgi:hypothetical protein